MQLTVNGERVAVEERPGESLLQLLREQVGLRSMKDGCAPEGSCGACTVIVDGRAVVSCAQPASRFADRDVRTLEGLSAEGRADWADAFVRGGASQCGFCSPGIVMKAEALLARAPDPSRDEIARALAARGSARGSARRRRRPRTAWRAQDAPCKPSKNGDRRPCTSGRTAHSGCVPPP